MHKRHYEKFADGSVKDIEDEIPFDVPDGWSWCRLKEISLDMADGPFGSNLKTEHYTTRKEARLIQLSNIGEEGWREENTKYTTFEHAKKNITRSIVESGNIVIAKMMPAGRAIICPNNEKMYVLSSDAVKLIPSILIYSKYLLNTINSPSFRNSVTDNVQGSTRLRTSISKLKECFIPLPPLSEQQLIVAEIEKIFAQIDLLEQNKTDLQTAIKQAKSKILDLAIHGKLVSQDPNDEPASALLEKIRAEKEAKIANGELKRDKNDSYIYKGSDNCHYQKNADGSIANIEDEIPFEVPEGWSWLRLSLLGEYKKGPFGSALTKSMFVPKAETTIKVYEQKNAIHKNSSLGDYYISKEYFETKMKSFEVFPGDIIVSCAGTIGETYILPKNIERGIINQALMRMKITDKINVGYFLMFFDHILKDESAKSGKGTAIKNIPPFDVFKQFLFPLPPLTEQPRIVAKIEELFTLLDNIQNNLI